MNSEIKFFSGRATEYLSKEIVKAADEKLGNVSFFDYSDGEFQISYDETVRGDHVFIIQSTFAPTENLFELLLMIDAAVRSSAYKVIAVIPYFGFARQDRKDKPRVALGAKLVANLLTAAGVSRVMTMDLHADQIQGFFDVPVDHLFASSIFYPYITQLNLENLVIASPDMGGSKRANTYASFLKTPLVICHKDRKRPNEVSEMKVIGDVKDKNVIILDDIVDTAGTLTKAANLMIEKGATSVRAAITHPVLSGNAYERIENSQIKELIVTDSIPLKQKSDKITVISVASLFADVIKKVYSYQSISSNFIQ